MQCLILDLSSQEHGNCFKELQYIFTNYTYHLDLFCLSPRSSFSLYRALSLFFLQEMLFEDVQNNVVVKIDKFDDVLFSPVMTRGPRKIDQNVRFTTSACFQKTLYINDSMLQKSFQVRELFDNEAGIKSVRVEPATMIHKR